MNEVKCEVIRDLLPLYEDGAASAETQELVRKHLADCPACREELRKMRTPISMPPDEDGEAVKRFLEHRAEVRRKQNRKIACAASVLAVLLTFCLCYTLIPRSWKSVSKAVEPDQLMGSHFVWTFRSDNPGADLWQLEEDHQADPAAVNAIMEALRAGSYRAELRNVMNYTPFAPLLDTSVQGFGGAVYLYLVAGNEIVASVYVYDTSDHLVYVGINGHTYTYHTDAQLYDTLSALMQEYGTFQED